MSRGVGAVDLIQELLPDWVALGVALLTQLGDLWFVGGLLGMLYLVRADRRGDIVRVLAGLFVGLGLYRGFKFLFGLPRPGQPLVDPGRYAGVVGSLYEATATATSYGFPSGHATTATIVYLGLATVLTVSSRQRRFAVATLLLSIVALSRVALGVHYLVDVVAGTVLGCVVVLTVVYGLGQVTDDAPTAGLVLGVIAVLFYVAASGAEPKSLLSLGAVLGSLAGWQLVLVGEAALTGEAWSRGRLAGAVLAVTLLGVGAGSVVIGVTPVAVAGGTGLVAAVGFAVVLSGHSSRLQQALSTLPSPTSGQE